MNNQDPHALALQIQELYNAGQYRAAADTFSRCHAMLANKPEQQKALDSYRIIRTRSLFQLNDIDGVNADLAFLSEHYHNDDIVMLSTRYMLEHLGLPQLIFAVKSEHPFIIAGQASYAKQIGDAERYLQLCEYYRHLLPHEKNRQIKLTQKNSDQHFSFEDNAIKQFVIQGDLPNNNLFIKASLILDNIEVELFLPGPENDGICDEGSLSTRIDGRLFKEEIIRHQVKPLMQTSPFGLEVETGTFNLKIYDVHCVRTDT